MRTGFIAKSIGLLALTASALANAGHEAGNGDVDVDIVSERGRSLALYPVRGNSYEEAWRAYVEAQPQENYAIRVRNTTPGRIGVVIAVDGRNIISGKKSRLKSNERMYVLGPYQSATYTGWRTGNDRVNRFYFTESDDSYAGAFGDYSAMGVIAVASFRENARYREDLYSGPRSEHRDYDDYDSSRGKSGSSDKSARRAPTEKHGSAAEPGTGYGDTRYSPSVRVSFDAQKRASGLYYIKYEWRDQLCAMDVLDCRRKKNRFWDSDRYGFAPPPPTYGYRNAYRR